MLPRLLSLIALPMLALLLGSAILDRDDKSYLWQPVTNPFCASCVGPA
jgi:hypothetical protein